MTSSFFGSTQDPGIERRDRETLEREKETQRLIEAEKEEEEILTDNAERIREKDLEANPPLENLEFQGLETKPEHWLLRSLGWVGDRFDDVDRAAGIGEFNVYNARQKVLKPLSETHVALGILGEFFVPDTFDIATAGLAYIPKRFAKIPKVWAKLTKAMNGDAARAILKGDDMLVDAATGMRIKAGGNFEANRIYADRPDRGGLIDGAPIDEGSEWAAKQQRLIDDEYDLTTLDPTRKFPANKRYAAAQRTTGKRTTRAQEIVFVKYSKDILDQLSKKTGINFGPNRPGGIINQHHKGVVRQIGATLDGLTDAAAKEGGDYMSKRLGFKLGYDIENAVPIPIQFHDRVHDIINDAIGISGTNIKGLEKNFNLPKNWQDTMGLRARVRSGMFDEVTDTIAESVKAIDVFWNGLQTRTNLKGLSPEDFMEATLDVLKLDKKLANTPSTAFSKSTATATESINTLLERAGKINLQSPVFTNLTPEMTIRAWVFSLKENGFKALQEAIVTGQDPATIFKAYGLDTKGFEDLFVQLGLPGITKSKELGAGSFLGRPKGSPNKKPKGTLRRKRDAEKFSKDTDLNPKNPDIDETKPIVPDD